MFVLGSVSICCVYGDTVQAEVVVVCQLVVLTTNSLKMATIVGRNM
jgi:hypothetical protein